MIIIYFLFKGSHSCSQNNGMCSDLCLLKPGGYQCACPTGIVLKEDGKNCGYGEVTHLMFQALQRRGGEICYHWSCISRTRLRFPWRRRDKLSKFRKKVKIRAISWSLWTVCTPYYGFPKVVYRFHGWTLFTKIRSEAGSIITNFFLAFIYLFVVVVAVYFWP